MPRLKKPAAPTEPSNPYDLLTPSDLIEGIKHLLAAERFSAEELLDLTNISHAAWSKARKTKPDPEKVAGIKVENLMDMMEASRARKVIPTLDWGAQPELAVRHLVQTMYYVDLLGPKVNILPSLKAEWLAEIDGKPVEQIIKPTRKGRPKRTGAVAAPSPKARSRRRKSAT